MNKKFVLLLERNDNQSPLSQNRKNNIKAEFEDMMSHFNKVKFEFKHKNNTNNNNKKKSSME